ncbi:MAG: DUF445 family protein [Firmicutes bacterium]|nr:DUF445 family protein [Bacillota bacterium]
MIWKILAAPIIGAIIGYCTNWLAVKMLFRPSEAKYIGRFHVPFTPGVIPKGKSRLARAIGNVVNTQLLTEETLKERLLAEEAVGMVKNITDDTINHLKNDSSKTVKLLASGDLNESEFNAVIKNIQEFIIEKAYVKLKNADLGLLISKTITSKMEEALGDSFLGKMMGDSMINMVGGAVTQSVDAYIEQNGEHIIRQIVITETENLLSMPAERIISGIESTGYDITGAVSGVYVRLVQEKADTFINIINAGEIAEKTIENMTNSQLEELVMATMKTELTAIVNLGALIGLVLGLINMAIYLI